MSTACAACDGNVRKGTGTRTFVLLRGELKPGNVCRKCMRHAVSVVTPPPTTVAPACSVCKRAHAAVCLVCAERLGAHVKELSVVNAALAITKGAGR